MSARQSWPRKASAGASSSDRCEAGSCERARKASAWLANFAACSTEPSTHASQLADGPFSPGLGGSDACGAAAEAIFCRGDRSTKPCDHALALYLRWWRALEREEEVRET